MNRTKPILFQKYPELEKNIHWKQLIDSPTPVERLPNLEEHLGYSGLWVKRDDQTGSLYGGNKIRKLEFIIADALAKKKKWIFTVGGLGSNHALATSIYAREEGLKTILTLIDQPVTDHVKEQLRRFIQFGAKISYGRNFVGTVVKGLWHLTTKRGVYFLGPGGSNDIGNLGFVEAALELSNQIEQGICPKPKRIYVAIGSMGTYVGLKIGFVLANLDIDLVGVRVTDIGMTDEKKTLKMANGTMKHLNKHLHNSPLCPFSLQDIHIDHRFAGPCYGSVTYEGIEALDIAKNLCEMTLETTYTGKAFASMVDYIRCNEGETEPLLFWNTYNSVDLPSINIEDRDLSKLPRSFHKFFR